ncbi:MAG: BON domain-containing protein [Rickettsiales bacterium]|jgi:osmotically-inducible protein OsmY|nr:BON domain-containing protein [Rickettsiales bacterium]
MNRVFGFLLIFLLVVNGGCVRTVATGSKIAGEITRLYRDTNQVNADLMLEKLLRKDIETHRKKFLYTNNLSDFGYYDIKVMEGRVLLSGIVFDSKTRDYLVDKVARNVKVRELLDELSMEERRGLTSTKTRDYFLEKSINMKIFFSSKIRSLNYEASVINGRVYVIGIAKNNEEHESLVRIISMVSGVREVISYVITIDSPKKLKIEYI